MHIGIFYTGHIIKKNYTLVYFKNLERSAHKSNTTVKTRISIPRAPT